MRAFLLAIVLVVSVYGFMFATTGLMLGLTLTDMHKGALLQPPLRPAQASLRGPQKDTTAEWIAALSTVRGDLDRETLIAVNKQEARIELGCSFPASSEPAQRIARGDIASASTSFIQAAFGAIWVNREYLYLPSNLAAPWSIDAESGRMHVHIVITRVLKSNESGVYIDIKRERALESVRSDALAILLRDASFGSLLPLPDSLSADTATVFKAAPASLPRISVGVSISRTIADYNRKFRIVEAPRAVLVRLDQLTDSTRARSLVLSIASVIPALLFLYFVLLSDRAPPVSLKILSRIAAAPILLFLVPRAFSFLERYFQYSWAHAKLLERWLGGHNISAYTVFTSAISSLEFVLLGIVLPVAIAANASAEGAPPRRGGRRLFLGVLAVLVVVIAIAVLAGPPRTIAAWRHIVILIAASMAVSLATLVGIVWSLGDQTVHRYVAIAGTIFLVTWSVLDQVPIGKSVAESGETVLTTLCGALLVGSCALMTQRSLEAARLRAKEPISALRALIVMLLCVILGAPIARLLSSTSLISQTLDNLAHSLSFLALWAWSIAVAVALMEQAKTTLAVNEICRAGGLVVLCGALFGTQATWLFIPITFLIGWLVFDHLLVRPASDSSDIESLSKDRRGRARKLIKQILDLNASERAYLAYRRKQREKFINGDIDLKTFQSGLAAVEEELETVRSATALRGTTAKAGALGLGPEESAAGNAWHGVRWALLLASPWIIASILNVLTTPKDQSAYPLWDLIYSVAAILIRWAACGFFFGYFFSYIRGASGIQKAFWTFLACALAQAPHAALTITSVDQAQALILWNLQLFTVLMLLGLVAFDYVTLRRAGYRSFSVLFELHDVPTIGASASSILVAMGVTTATFLEGSAKQLITLVLQLIIPPELAPKPGGQP